MDDLQLTTEQEAQLMTFVKNQPHGTIVRCSDAPQTLSMICFEKYVGQQITAVRKQVDQLDQVTVWWNPYSQAHRERFIK